MPRGHRRSSAGEAIEETRNTILRTARQLFMEYGYRAVSTRQIADACDLTQPALYHYFSDKQELYFVVVQEIIVQTQAGLEQIAQLQENVPERLRQIARYLVSTNRIDIGMMLHDIQHELNERAREELYKQFYAGMLMPIASVFEDGIRQGLLSGAQHYGIDALMAADLFMNMLKRFILARPRFLSLDSEASTSPPEKSSRTSYLEQAECVVPVLLFGLTNVEVNYPSFVPGAHTPASLSLQDDE
ncbi:TetR/AcrR family transcriptional regulator [Ktedonospora formicarum]|uniref:TetR family transcriptional regulator n=1 Tax=Ktedonospora formicarum TaxID=2778364 RepID=A0A8J3HW87_9CHLR|nr:TetR/AcrR family transcriptional regulator [Ktedonospora formicarum]GHO44376.1 TetR family transcriptional regulator [Ktedonospora formicarum]